MATTKVTFTLDSATVERPRRTAERLDQPQSQVVRAAIRDYAERAGRLSESERRRLLDVFDELVPRIPLRPQAAVDTELAGIRRARRRAGR